MKIGELYGKLAQPTTIGPTQAELDAADGATTNWLMYNKGYRAERYSTLRQINTGNAGKLRPVCMFQLGELGTFSTGPGRVRRHSVCDDASRHVRDRRDHLQKAMERTSTWRRARR